MKTRNIFGVFLVLLTFAFAGCNDKNDEDGIDDVTLEYTTLNTGIINATYEIPITTGSGDYKTEIEDPSIADVSVKAGEEACALVIFTKKEGETTVTLTDNKTGKFVTCSLSVRISVAQIKVTGIEYNIDAVQKQVIIDDIEKGEPYPVGSSLTIDPFRIPLTVGAKGIWRMDDAGGNTITREEYIIGETEVLPLYLTGLFPQQQVLWYNTFKVGEKELPYYLVGFRLPSSSMGNQSPSLAYIIIYEDLTQYYRTEYPDAGVGSVVRSYIFNPWE